MDLENGEPPKLYGVNLQPPAPFDFANPATWSTWLSRYEDFTAVSGLTKASEDVQVRSLLYCMGPEARPLLETFSLDAQSLASYQVVAARFTEHFVHPANELYESSRFHRRVQLPGESVDTYYAELCRMVKRCNYPSAAVEERLVRDRFVVGLRDSRLSDQLCRNAKLTLKEAWTQARQSEDADKEKELTQNRTEHTRELNLDAAKASKYASRRRSGAKPTTSQPPTERSREPSTCEFCGRAPHRRSDCPHQQNKLGSVHLHAVGTPAAAKFVDVTVDNYTAQFKVDSGAEVSAVPSDFLTLPAKLDKVDSLLTGPGGQPLRVLGSYLARLRWQGKTSCQRLYVIQSLTVPLLGLPALQALKVVKFLDELKTPKATLHAELFKGLGTLKDEYVIQLKPDAVPFSLSVPRRIHIPLLEVVRRELDKLESAGVIRRIDKPIPWCSGLIVVRKDDGSYRLCVDLTQLNKVVLRERHILPTVEQVLGLLGDATVFSRLDATASFHQVKLSADSQELTTFITPYGRYCFCRLPFGITSAPEYFQKQMARILEGQEGVANMIDDILVFGRTRQEHDARLSQVLSRLAKAGITLNEDKCRFGVSEVSFLGVVVSAKGIRPDPSKVEAVKAMEAPTDVAGVRRLLGMVNHLARFLPHISDVTAPIRALLNKSASWVWQHEQEAAFKKVKELLTSYRCMAMYHPSYATTVSADASSFGLGAAQESDGECKALISFCQRGWPPKTKLPLHVSKYAFVADELSVCDGILLKGPRIVIPSSLRPAVLTLLHEGHQGINRTKALARESVWWPGISADIASLVTNCEQCASTRVNLAEPLVSTALPGRPWEFLGMDLFHLNGQTFLLVVDYYSRFPEVVTLRSTTARAVIDALKSIFARHGIPQDVRSDNGPPFSSQEFAAFAASYGFNHATSSPHYAQSNGEAERMVRTVKDLFRKCKDPHLALLSYRDTPGVDGFSPAQLLMGRQLRTRVPKQNSQLHPNWPPRKDVVAKDVAYKRKQTDDYNRHHGARDLPPLQTSQRVWVRPDQVQATVLSPGQRPRSYVVETDRGGVLQCNRRHLVPFVPSASGEESLPTAAQQPSPPQQVLQEPQPANSMGPASPKGSLCNIPQQPGTVAMVLHEHVMAGTLFRRAV
ncbi:uncharacterized protein K02A2.6-like [Rhipicephalus sanguineus]|uniref:uncharacterized protein K02A2.6-like n=1 Tax=Rhipicephalus sanguineus TaxID=34632 RepID=UPI0018950631|nr:uncharacterized protein K02A2.6-like [Rhipicephalus sanguineus]